MYFISDFKVIYLLLLLYYYELIINMNLSNLVETKCIYTSWGITDNMTFTTTRSNKICEEKLESLRKS